MKKRRQKKMQKKTRTNGQGQGISVTGNPTFPGVPVFNMKGRWASTTNLQLALSNGYIGEAHWYPDMVAYSVKYALYGTTMRMIKAIYYGTPDDYLKKLFSIKD